MNSPGGNNIDPPPQINHSLPNDVHNIQEALANIDAGEGEKKKQRAAWWSQKAPQKIPQKV